MKKIGITGGIGSGKTVVAKLLELMGIPVYYADTEAKRILRTSPVVKEKLINLFGANVYKNSLPDKRYLASVIFNDKEALAKTNAIIHPEVGKDFSLWAAKQQTTFVAMEAAILFESGFDKKTDLVLTVTAPLELRISRVIQRDGLTEEQIRERINNQLPEEEKIKRADFVIYNDDKHSVIRQVSEFLSRITEYQA